MTAEMQELLLRREPESPALPPLCLSDLFYDSEIVVLAFLLTQSVFTGQQSTCGVDFAAARRLKERAFIVFQWVIAGEYVNGFRAYLKEDRIEPWRAELVEWKRRREKE